MKECFGPLGMENLSIPNSAITASSQQSSHLAYEARLRNNNYWQSTAEGYLKKNLIAISRLNDRF